MSTQNCQEKWALWFYILSHDPHMIGQPLLYWWCSSWRAYLISKSPGGWSGNNLDKFMSSNLKLTGSSLYKKRGASFWLQRIFCFLICTAPSKWLFLKCLQYRCHAFILVFGCALPLTSPRISNVGHILRWNPKATSIAIDILLSLTAIFFRLFINVIFLKIKITVIKQSKRIGAIWLIYKNWLNDEKKWMQSQKNNYRLMDFS